MGTDATFTHLICSQKNQFTKSRNKHDVFLGCLLQILGSLICTSIVVGVN